MNNKNTKILAAGGPQELINISINFENINTMDNYYIKSRYIPFQKCCECIKQYLDINTCLDLCTSSGHFVYVALENNINCEGFDLEFKDIYNKIFSKKFNKKPLFQFDLNNIHTLNKKYDIITNFHLTHIFDTNSFLYLLKILSNITKYTYLHISKSNKTIIKNYDFIDIIDFHDYKINMHGTNTTTWVFLKFKNSIKINKIKEFIRPKYLITLKD
tara:strand:+ start:312 stop:959 length:648 start_codon:yes stop_codon:yes gene_type:complete